jgi:hypothetical protein
MELILFCGTDKEHSTSNGISQMPTVCNKSTMNLPVILVIIWIGPETRL